MLDLDDVLRVLRKLSFALWVRCAALLYRHRRKLKHPAILSCTVSAYASRCCVQTSDARTGLLSCYSEELRTVELPQIKEKIIMLLLAAVVHTE